MAVVAPGGSERIAAFAIVALMIVLPAIWIGWSLNTASALSDDVRSQAETLNSLQTRLAALNASAAGDQAKMASVYLPGATSAIAGAALQQIVAAAVESAGGHLAESEIVRPQAEAEPGAVNLRVSFDTDIVGLQHVLFDLETGAPILMVTSITVSAPAAADAAPTESPALSVVMMVSGRWEA